jgi:FkbM family methyltransferase
MQRWVKAAKSCQRLITAKALMQGISPTWEHETIMRSLKVDTVVDVGANVGQFSLLSRICWPESQVFAFEPLPGAAEKFRKIFQNDHRVTLSQCAVGTTTGQLQFHISSRDDSSSLLPITSAQEAFAPGTQETATTSVSVRPLSDLLTPEQLAHPALLKIDVQGYEDRVLRSAGPLLPHFTFIFCELSFRELYAGQARAHEIIEYLMEQGFHLIGVSNLSADKMGMTVQADFLFQHA